MVGSRLICFRVFLESTEFHGIKYDNDHGVTHDMAVGPHVVTMRYMRFEKNHYTATLTIDGKIDRRGKRPLPHHHIAIYHAVRNSMKEFTKDKDPRVISFVGDTRYKQSHWKKMGAKIAHKLGAKDYLPGNVKDMESHWIVLRGFEQTKDGK